MRKRGNGRGKKITIIQIGNIMPLEHTVAHANRCFNYKIYKVRCLLFSFRYQ